MTNDLPFIPVAEPEIGDAERAYVLECLQDGWIGGEGPKVARVEQELAARVNRQHGIAVINGSAALDCSFAALNLRPGDEVILPTFTIISCAAAIVRAGGTPVTVDCDPLTWTMQPREVAERIGPRTRAILVVHIYGMPADADPILDLAKIHGLFVVEDAAEAIGQTYRRRPCGSLGDLSIFSFYANKNLTTGEGGMVMTDDSDLATRCRSLRNLCFQGAQRFKHEELGWNWRMSNLQAAFGCGQLERLDDVIRRKRKIGLLYEERLCAFDQLQRPILETDYAVNDFWVYGIVLDDSVSIAVSEVMRLLAARGIGTRPFFWPMHEQPALHKLGFCQNVTHPHAERLARRGFYLPTSVTLTESAIDRVCDGVRSILN